MVNVSESEVSVFFLASPSTALLLVVGGSKCHAPDSRMSSCFFFTRFGGRGIFFSDKWQKDDHYYGFPQSHPGKKTWKAGVGEKGSGRQT
jgi:hypothetical protein